MTDYGKVRDPNNPEGSFFKKAKLMGEKGQGGQPPVDAKEKRNTLLALLLALGIL
jgi:hypothetical protein